MAELTEVHGEVSLSNNYVRGREKEGSSASLVANCGDWGIWGSGQVWFGTFGEWNAEVLRWFKSSLPH